MDNIIYGEAEQDILCFRLQSARRKKRMQHEDFEKKLLALHREQRELYKQERALGWIELKPPVMRGWKRFFVLREDVARSKHAAFFEGILNKINKVEYSSRKDFKVKKRRGGKKVHVARDQQLLRPDEYHFRKLGFSEKETQLFEVRYVKEKWMKQPQKIFVFVEPWRFVLRVRPNMITRIRARDEQIERRKHYINSFLEKNALQGKLSRLLGDSYRWRMYGEKEGERNPLKNKPVAAILNDLTEEVE
jgi:hypothetical protein